MVIASSGSGRSVRSFLSIRDFTRTEIQELFILAAKKKREVREGQLSTDLAGKVLALVFHKPSLRTRVSFEVGMLQLGGSAVYITDKEIGIGQREPVADVARVLSRYVDGIMVRTFDHSLAVGLAAEGSVPVINGLTDLLHPCQVLSDLFTAVENGKDLDSMCVAYIGDGNNVCNSWLNASTRFRFTLRVCVPEGQEPSSEIMEAAVKETEGSIQLVRNALEAAQGADIVYTDVWASMGQEKDAEAKKRAFAGFTVDARIVEAARPDCLVMHCLPAHRGEEITDEVIEGPRSVVFDEAENRLHLQKAILLKLLS
ncbi:MAG: ornithine carbamoyltransferase [Candidatus Eiseniibacteriota bacterium]|nr:MAG: ornithine carbamoyltransferase [Candidatus Eisenbacteria bacterium]